MANIYGVKFDKINDYFDLDDNAAWDILMANGDQFYAFWLEQDTNTGADSQYWFSNNSFNASNSVQCFVSETADTFRFNPQNATQQATTPAKTFPTGRVFIVCQYNSSTDRLEISYCEEGGLNERTVATVDLADDISSANWNLGRRQDGNSGRYYEGKIFNLAKGDTYLSNAQVEALASDFLNYDPNDEFTPAIYFPMNEGTGTTITDDVLGLVGTGIGFPGDNSQWILEGQSGAVISITEELKNINYASLDPVISLSGSISITENLVNTNYTALNPVIDLTGIVSITEQLKNISYTGLNPTITLTPTGVIVVNEKLVNVNYNSLNPTVDLTGLVDITESLVNTNYTALNPVITLTSGAIEIIEQTVNTQYNAINPSILLTPEPIGIVSTVCFDGVLVELIYNGLQNNLEYNGKSINIEFNGNFNELEFNGTIQTTCNPGSIKTNC